MGDKNKPIDRIFYPARPNFIDSPQACLCLQQAHRISSSQQTVRNMVSGRPARDRKANRQGASPPKGISAINANPRYTPAAIYFAKGIMSLFLFQRTQKFPQHAYMGTDVLRPEWDAMYNAVHFQPNVRHRQTAP